MRLPQPADPVHADDYRANLETWLKEIDAVDADVRAALKSTPAALFSYPPGLGLLLPVNTGLRCSL